MKNNSFQKHLNKVVERDLIIFDLERLRDAKPLTPIEKAIGIGCKYKEPDGLKHAIRLVKRLIKLNDYMEISNDGQGDPRELL